MSEMFDLSPVCSGRGFLKFTIMANEKNLIPFDQRSESEARELGRKGGIASGEARREKSTLIGTIAQVIDVELNPDKVRQRVINLGYPPEMAEKVIAIAKLFNIDAQVVGHIEEGKKSLTIKSEFGVFEYE